jgi:hypothetical protein
MLFPRSHAWTARQKRLIVGSVVLAIASFAALVCAYEAYHRGPSEAALYGTWQDTKPALDSETYYRFKPDGRFDILMDGMGELSVVTTGTWYAGGPNIYWRLPAELVGERRPLIWHIEDISPSEIRVRSFRQGAVTIWKRVDLPTPPRRI